MSLFDQLGTIAPARSAPRQQQQAANPMQEMQRLRANPASYLKNRGYTIPDGMTDPTQITQHLIRSGQIGSQKYQMVMQMLNGMRR